MLNECLSDAQTFDLRRAPKTKREEMQTIKRQRIEAGAVVLAQMVERSLQTPKIRGSNPVIGNIYHKRILSTALKRRK